MALVALVARQKETELEVDIDKSREAKHKQSTLANRVPTAQVERKKGFNAGELPSKKSPS